MDKMKTILEEAATITDERADSYGEPSEHFQIVAAVWSEYLGVCVRAPQVIGCMILLKLVRESHQHKRDNLVDIAGYANILNRLYIP